MELWQVFVAGMTLIVGIVALVVTLQVRLEKTLTREIRAVDARVDRLDGKIDGVEERLTSRIDALDVRLTGRIDSLEGRIDALDAKLERRYDVLDAKIDGVKQQVLDLAIRLVPEASAKPVRQPELTHHPVGV